MLFFPFNRIVAKIGYSIESHMHFCAPNDRRFYNTLRTCSDITPGAMTPPHDILNMLLGAQNMLLSFLSALLKYSRGGGEFLKPIY